MHALVLPRLSRCDTALFPPLHILDSMKFAFSKRLPVHQQSILLRNSKDWSFCEWIIIADGFLDFVHFVAYIKREVLVFLAYRLLLLKKLS